MVRPAGMGILALVLLTGACKPTVESGKDDELGDVGLAATCANGDKHACEQQVAVEEKRCTAGVGEGCVLQGLNYENERALQLDEVKATTYFMRACTLNDGDGCWYASRQYAYGRGANKDPVRAADLSEQACTLGSVNGCMDLGVAFRNGEGRPKDLNQAHTAYARACSLGKLSTGSGCQDAHALETKP